MNNTATIDPLGNVTTYTYDALTRETASYSGQYDALGRQIRVTQPRPDGSTAAPVEQTLAAPTPASGWMLQTTGGYDGSYYTGH